MIRLIDRDDSGTVNFQEFSQLVKASIILQFSLRGRTVLGRGALYVFLVTVICCSSNQAHENSPARQEAIMREAFMQFDSDRDGLIQLDDLRRMAVRLGEVVEDDMLQSMLHDADVDADDGTS